LIFTVTWLPLALFYFCVVFNTGKTIYYEPQTRRATWIYILFALFNLYRLLDYLQSPALSFNRCPKTNDRYFLLRRQQKQNRDGSPAPRTDISRKRLVERICAGDGDWLCPKPMANFAAGRRNDRRSRRINNESGARQQHRGMKMLRKLGVRGNKEDYLWDRRATRNRAAGRNALRAFGYQETTMILPESRQDSSI